MVKLSYIIAQLDLNPLPKPGGIDDGSIVQTVFYLALTFAGAVALLIMTLAGFRLAISRGDPATVAKSKNTIIFSLVGLMVIASASIIVRFVFDNL